MVAQTAEPISFEFLPQIPVVVQQHHGQISSDAGLLPLREFDAKLNYTQRMADCLEDPKPNREHSLLSMLRQRFYGILAGYEDCNDHDTLREDPIIKLVAGRLPDDTALASQPTLSRFENLATPAMLQKLVDFTIATGVERLKEKHGGRLPGLVTLDIDPTDDAAHGKQQLTLFHGYYDQFQYYPLIISEPTTKHVFVAWLRHGTAHASLGADDDLMRIVNALRAERPDIVIHVRGDAGLATPQMYEVCETNGLLYTFGFSSNARLKSLTDDLMKKAEAQFEETKEKVRLFACFQYRCDGWSVTRPVIAKVECHAGGTNRRFVVTNVPSSCPLTPGLTDTAPVEAAILATAPIDTAPINTAPIQTAPIETAPIQTAPVETAPVAAPPATEPIKAAPVETAQPQPTGITTADEGEIVYDDYIQRGESEHRMDELKNGLHMDRLSCHRFMANFFRLLLYTCAYNFLNAVRDDSRLPDVLRVGQPCTWRTNMIKVAAEVVQTTRRVIIRLAAQWPWWPLYQAVSARCIAFAPTVRITPVAFAPSS